MISRCITPELRRKARKFIDYAVQSSVVDNVWQLLPILWDKSVNDPEFQKWYDRDVNSYTALFIETVRLLADRQEDPYSYNGFMREPLLRTVMEALSESAGPTNTALIFQICHQMISHERAGKRVYSVSPVLAEQLKNTELRGIRGEDLKLPYESIYIEVPKSLGMMVCENIDEQPHPLTGMYITRESRYTDFSCDEKFLERRPIERGWQILLVGWSAQSWESDDFHPTNITDDALSFYRIPLIDGVKVESSIKRLYEEMLRDFRENPFTTWNQAMVDNWEQQFRWAMNVVLYATWEEPGEHWIANKEARQLWERIQKLPSKSKKRSRLSKKFQTLNPQRRIQLGASIVINRRKSGREGSESSGDQGHQVPEYLRIKTRVSGHWKRVCYGKKGSLRRMQWVEPYWKNKDGLTPIREPNHVLK